MTTFSHTSTPTTCTPPCPRPVVDAQAGARIAELVLQLLDGKAPADVHELWPSELVLRESSGPRT